MSSQRPHFSTFKQGTWKNGAWHCGHNERAAERMAERGENFGMKCQLPGAKHLFGKTSTNSLEQIGYALSP
jgi:hypothetical protein